MKQTSDYLTNQYAVSEESKIVHTDTVNNDADLKSIKIHGHVFPKKINKHKQMKVNRQPTRYFAVVNSPVM